MYKTQAEVEARLQTRYAGPTERRKGFTDKATGETTFFTYIPWEEMVKTLNDVFGVFGWSTTTPQVTVGDGFVTVAFGLTVSVAGEGGEIITKTTPCVDSSAADDQHGAKKAMSGALVKGAQLLGDAMGFYIGPEEKAKKKTTNYTSGDGLGARPSPKQAAILEKNHITYQTMPFAEWKKALDDIFAGMKKEPVF